MLGQQCTNNCFSYIARCTLGTRFGKGGSGWEKGEKAVLKRQPNMAAGHSSLQKPNEHTFLSAVECRGLLQQGCRSAGAYTPPQGTDQAGLCQQEGYRHGLAHQARSGLEDTQRKASRKCCEGARQSPCARHRTRGGGLSEEKFLPSQLPC